MAIRYGFSAVSVVLSAAFLALGFVIPRQFIRTMTILKGGNTVRLVRVAFSVVFLSFSCAAFG